MNLTPKRENQILGVHQFLQDAMDEGVVRIFKPEGEWD
jgi:hypothetical protein